MTQPVENYGPGDMTLSWQCLFGLTSLVACIIRHQNQSCDSSFPRLELVPAPVPIVTSSLLSHLLSTLICISLELIGGELTHLFLPFFPEASQPSFAFDRVIPPSDMALDNYYRNKIEGMKLEIIQGQAVLRRLEAQRNDYNSRVRLLREELGLLQQPGSYVGEVVKVMSTKKVLVKVHPEGKYGASLVNQILLLKLVF